MNEQAPLDEQTVSPRPKMSPQNRLRLGLLILIALLLAAVAGGYAYLYNQQSKELQILQSFGDDPRTGTQTSKRPAAAKGALAIAYANDITPLIIKEWGVEFNVSASAMKSDFFYHQDFEYYQDFEYGGTGSDQGEFATVKILSRDLPASCPVLQLFRGPLGAFSGPDKGIEPTYIATIGQYEYASDIGSIACVSVKTERGVPWSVLVNRISGSAMNLRPIQQVPSSRN